MAAPHVHSMSSAKKWGGDLEDYLAIHEKMDCQKGYFPDNRGRVLTHTMFWVKGVMVPLFGSYITISTGRKVSVKDICEQHILEDFRQRFIPTPQDYIEHMQFQPWMNNGVSGTPSSHRKIKGEKSE